MKQMKLVLKLATTFFAVFLIFATLSCEVGLGSAVDTERPDLEITYPPKGAIISDTFTLAGTVADDIGVSFINVVLTHKTLKTEYVYKSSEGQVTIVNPANGWSKGTTWTANICKKVDGQTLYNGWDLPDGDYFIDVEAADVEGSVYDRRSITIDNTPPVFIVENLTSLGTENNADRLSTFGQKINLSGKAKDDTGISKVFFDVYDENQKFIGSSSMDYDMSSDGILLAQYSASNPENEREKVLAQNYNMVYGLQENQKLPEKIDPAKDIKTRYMTFRLADNARTYNTPVYTNSEEEGSVVAGQGDGNISTEIYLNTQAFGLENITIDELSEYRKHLKDDAEMDAKLKKIASSSLASVSLDSNNDFSKITKMQINPEIDPKWYVGSYELKDSGEYEQAFVGSTLTVMFAAGYDNVQFKPSNIRIVLAKLSDDGTGAYTKILASDDELRNQATDSENVIVLKNYGGSEELTLNLTQPVALSSEFIKTPNRYRIMVFGKDGPLGNGLDFKEKNGSWYGIKAVKNATPPKITILNTNEDAWIGPNTESFDFNFTISIDGENLVRKDENDNKEYEEPTVTVSVTDSNGENVEYNDYIWEKISSSKADKLYTFNWKLRNKNDGQKLPMPNDNGNYKLAIKIEAQDDSEGYASKTFKLNIDKEAPEVTFEAADPYINENGIDYLNGTVTIPVTFKDNRGINKTEKPTYCFNWGSTNTTGSNELSIENNKGKINLNTVTTVPDKTPITLSVTASDEYGNTTTATKEYTVDQETDKPKLLFGNLELGNDYDKNSFGLTSGNRISASATDDDGNVKIEVKVWGVDDSTGTENTTPITENWTTMENSVSGLINFDFYNKGLITKDGKYKLQFRVTDRFGLDTNTKLGTSEVTTGEYNIRVDGSAPIFDDNVVVTVGGNDVTKDGNYFYVPKSDSSSKTTVTVKLTEGNLNTVTVNGNETGVEKTLVDGSTTDWNITYTWTPATTEDDGEKELTFLAEDESGNSKEKLVSLYYDSKKPELSNVTANPVVEGDKVNGKIVLKGSVSDNDKIKSIVVTADNGVGEIYNGTESEFETAVVDTTKITADDTTQPINFTVVATDRAGNVKTETKTYTIDQTTDRPVITFDKDKIDENLTEFADIKAANDGKNVFGLNTNNVLTGTATDDDGIGEIKIVAYDSTGKTRLKDKNNDELEYTTTSSSFNCNINKLGIEKAGDYVIKVTATDKKEETGYASLEKTVYLVVDGEPPIINNIEVNGKNITVDEDGYIYTTEAFINGASTVSFTVTEALLQSVKINSDTLSSLPTPTDNVYTFTHTFTPSDTYKNKSVPFKIVATDKSGYETEMELNILYDVSAPVINKLELAKQITTYVNGVITITGNISDNDAIASTGVKIKDGDTEVAGVLKTPDGKTNSDTEFTYTVDTTAKDAADNYIFTDNHLYTLSVKTTDRAGNEETKSIPFYVNQETDKPIITFINAVKTNGASDASGNKFGIEGWTINGIVEDDDDLTLTDGGVEKSLTLTASDGGTVTVDKTSGAFAYVIPDSRKNAGVYDVTFEATDVYGKKNDGVKLYYVVDTEVPKIAGEIKLYNGTNSSGTIEYDTEGISYYDEMFAKEYHKFEFNVSDDNEVTKVEVSKNGGATWSEATLTGSGKTKTVTYAANEANGDITLKLRLTDKYGHQSPERELVYKVDTVAPNVSSATIKVADNDSFASKWFNTSMLNVSISDVTDANLSGAVSLIISGATTATESFNMNVVDNASPNPKSGSFSRARSFDNGETTLAYTFSDGAGNKAFAEVKVRVDTVAPTITEPSITGTGLSSDTPGVTKENSITASFNGYDEHSKLKSVTFGSRANFADTEKCCGYSGTLSDDAEQTISQEITISGLAEGTHQVWVCITDKAENSAYYEIGSFIVDQTAPAVTFTSHSAGAKVNNKITLSGTVKDENLPEGAKPVLKCGTKVLFDDGATSKVNLISGMTCNVTGTGDTREWKFEGLDTSDSNIGDGTQTLTVEFKDKAGNIKSESIALEVDQDSDRPVVTLSDVNIGGKTTLSKGKISWEITDDDGTPKEVKVQTTAQDATSPTGTWVTVTADANGKYTYPADTELSDASYKLWFQIKDNADTIFTSSDTNGTLKQPKVQTRGGTDTTGDAVSFAVDSTPPTVNSVKIYLKTGEETVDGVTTDVYDEGKEINGDFYGGTLKKDAKIVIDAKDNVVTDPNDLVYKLKLNGEYANSGENITSEYKIDFSTISSGALTMTFEVYDNSGVAGTKTATVFVDNLAPNAEGKAVANMKPSPSTEVTGTVSVTANISDDSTARSGINTSTVAYYIPKSTETAPATIAEDKWIYKTNSTSAFEVTDVLLKFDLDSLTKSGGSTEIAGGYEGYEIGSTKIYNIPVWIKLSDKVGNTSYVTGNTIRYNPDADRPRVQVLDPVHTTSVGSGESKKDYVILGGNIRISGSAEDDEGIEGVYVQYDINGDGYYNKADVSWLLSKDYEIFKPSTGEKITTADSIGADANTSYDDWGVKARNTLSWQATFDATKLTEVLEIGHVNNSGEADNPTNKTLNIRVCAADSDSGKRLVSAWSDEIHVSVNNGIPSYDNMQLVQYSSASYAAADVIQRIDYSDDMYIPDGFWRLEGFVGDNGDITSIELTGSQSGTHAKTDFFTKDDSSHWDTTADAGLKGYKIHIPVNADKFKLKIVPYDNSNPKMKNPSNYSVLIDKNAPKFDGDKGDDDLVLYIGEYGEKVINANNKVQNSNGWTTIASKVNDADSGFAKAIFYLLRKGTGGNRVYNIMESSDNRTNLVANAAANGVYINSDNLPVLDVTATKSNTDKDKFVVSQKDIQNNANIRNGGVVIINGFYRTISNVDKNTANQITVTLAEEIDEAYTNVSFVYGAVVDHSGETLVLDTGDLSGDDGDGLAESITKSGTDYIWDATFDSTHIPDGPVEIHVVVFDNVGNKRHGKVDARISNNSPRLARVKLGTDLNGDGKIEDFETTTFVANSKYNKDTALASMSRDDFADVWNLDTRSEAYGGDYWKIKNKLKVTPEFVGGTGNIHYVFSKVEGIGNGTHLETAEESNSPTTLNDSITLENSTIGTNYDNKVNTYRFSFWDETEETTAGQNSGWAVLNAELYQDLTDGTKPVSIIHPFFWKGKGSGNNSIQWRTETDGTETALGHIELEGDLTEAIFKSSNSGVYDLDPKVSGKIVLRGTVFDETRLTGVRISSNDNSILGNKTLTATYDTSTNVWTTTGNETGKYVFTVKDVHGIEQIGHLVEWTLEVDTEKVSTVAKENVTFTVQAKDGGTEYSTENIGTTKTATSFTSVYATASQAANGKYYSTIDGAKNEDKAKLVLSATTRLHAPRQFNLKAGRGTNAVYEYRYGTTNHYQMDVMPYVTKVTTSLSAKDVNNPSKYDRTSLGHYPVQSVVSNVNSGVLNTTKSEDIILSGFNLDGTITVSAAGLSTGVYSYKVNKIDIINNINNNNAKGDAAEDGANYANWYNRMANGDNNNNLTDDIVFDVWEFNDRVAKPNTQTVEGTTMKVNSTNGLIQYAYSDGTYMAMSNGVNTTANSGYHVLLGYDTFQGPSIGFHIDSTGATYGCGHPSDTNKNNAIDFFRLITSKWGFKAGLHVTSNNLSVEGIGEKKDGTNTVIERQCIWSPSIATTPNGTTVNLYMAYYDQLWKEIRFRAGKLSASDPGKDKGFGMFYDRDVPTNAGEDTSDDEVKLRGAKVIADATHSGKYVSLAARNETIGGTSTDIVCIVWFDAQENKLMYAYQTMANADVAENDKCTAANWSFSNQKTLFKDAGGGQYCQIAFDAKGGVHVAAYAGNGHVYYAYATGYNETFTEYRIDATDTVGQNLTLDVALNSDKNPIPYIGYYSTIGKPKYAYLTDAAAATTDKAGVDDNGRYTENWNISVVPTMSALYISQYDKINVGVWKETTGENIGVITESTRDSNHKSTGGKGTTTTYGNGTANGVLVYQIVNSNGDTSNCIESAQLR